MVAPKIQRTVTDDEYDESPVHDIAQKFKDYTFRVNSICSEPYDVKKEAINVRIVTKAGEEYSAHFTTPLFIGYMFEMNTRTGECLSGTYFCMPGMVIVKELTSEYIKKTIDDLIERYEIQQYFTKLDD